MAVTSVTKRWSGESGGLTKELDFESKGKADFAAVYDVIVNAPTTDNSHTVKADALVPQLGEQLDSEFLWVTSVSVSRESPILFAATVGYSSLQLDPDDPDANPLLQPAKVKWSTVKAEGEIDEDINGAAISTPVNEAVLGIMRPFSDIKATVTQPFTSFDPFVFYDFIDHVNLDTFLGFPPGTAKVDTLSADPNEFLVEDVKVIYYDVSVDVLFRNPIRTTFDKAWYNRRALKGTKVLNDNGDTVQATDDNGENVTAPVYLTETGQQTTAANVVWVEDQIFPSANFSGMGFNF